MFALYNYRARVHRQLNNSDSSSKKYWATDAAAADDIILGGTDANERAPHLASIGDGGLLAMWEGSSASGDLEYESSGRTIYAQVRDASTGAAISEKVTVDSKVIGNRYQALKTFPDGNVVYLSMGHHQHVGASCEFLRLLSRKSAGIESDVAYRCWFAVTGL
ncbi:hypothetical protein PC129_g21820 [Phytophthora cactorum]|uniref:Uncharacterized protein n=2 Tax=Phytophthora cactorum TaxID=29920 RepID=A0A8T1H4R1_9STRA|nr:hypothetical protein PC129_g21820 [Phytophthora cactorum]